MTTEVRRHYLHASLTESEYKTLLDLLWFAAHQIEKVDDLPKDVIHNIGKRIKDTTTILIACEVTP